LQFLQSIGDSGKREGAVAGDAEHADPVAAIFRLAHGVDRVLDGAQHRTHRDHDGFGILGPVGAQQPAGIATEHRLEFRRQLRDALKCLHLLGVREIAHFHEGFRTDHRADRNRLVRVEYLARLVGRQVGFDLRRRRHVDTLVGVGEDEAVHAHHHRHRELLGQLEGLDVQVERFLVGFGEQLNPAAIALRERVGMVVPDVDRRADGPVGDSHDDRQAKAGRVIDRLDHEQQALRGSRRVAARAGRRGADGHRHGGEFGFDVDVLTVGKRTLLHHFA